MFLLIHVNAYHAVAVAQWVKAFAPQAEGWVFESQPWQTQVVKTGSKSSTAKRLALGMSVTGPRKYVYKRTPRVTVGVAR